jgi:hypothetical protein
MAQRMVEGDVIIIELAVETGACLGLYAVGSDGLPYSNITWNLRVASNQRY